MVEIWIMNLFIPSVHPAHGSYQVTEQLWEVPGRFRMLFFLLDR